MGTTLFLAKVFGLYLLVMGLLTPPRRKEPSAMIEALADHRPLVYLLLPFEVTARLVRWFNRPAWFTIGGALWAALAPSTFTLTPHRAARRAMKGVSIRAGWYKPPARGPDVRSRGRSPMLSAGLLT